MGSRLCGGLERRSCAFEMGRARVQHESERCAVVPRPDMPFAHASRFLTRLRRLPGHPTSNLLPHARRMKQAFGETVVREEEESGAGVRAGLAVQGLFKERCADTSGPGRTSTKQGANQCGQKPAIY